VFAFLDRLLQQRATFADIKDVVIHCATNERGLPFADGHGNGGMRKLWNRKPTVKQLCGADIKLFLKYCDHDPSSTWNDPSSTWNDEYEPAALELERFIVSL
jgi:hypothetical protein